MSASVSQVGETGRTVGVEHIPELVDRSIDAIKKTPAGALMETGQLVVHRMLLYATSIIVVFSDILILGCGLSTLNRGTDFEFLPSARLSYAFDCLGIVDADGKKGNEAGAPYDAIHVGAAAKGKPSFCRGIMLLRAQFKAEMLFTRVFSPKK